MNVLLALIWFVTLIAFIVFWRKKVNTKKKFGKDSSEYAHISFLKRIIGWICIASFIGCYIATPDKKPDPEPTLNVEQETETVKTEAASQKSDNSFQQAADIAVHKALAPEEIIDVKYEDSILTIKLDETKIAADGVNIPQIDILAGRVTAIGDKIADIPGIDETVKSVVVEFKNGKKIEMPTNIIKTNEYNMRYFPSAYIYDNLK